MYNQFKDFTEQIRKMADRFPPTMSLPLSRAITSAETNNNKETLINLLDFFEMSVQWLNSYFFALLSNNPDGRQYKGTIRAVKIIDDKRPLSFGDSVNEIFYPLLDSAVKIFPSHPLVKSLSENVKSRRIDILAGSAHEIGVIKIRNDYKGHSTSLSEKLYLDAINVIAPKVESMIRGLAPLSTADIYTIGTTNICFDLHGTWHHDNRSISTEKAGHYYVGFEGYPTLDLFPLIIQRLDKYIYIFQTLKGDKVKYESSDENVHGYETEEFNHSFDRFMQQLLPSFDISKEANWLELCNCMKNHSTTYMIQVQKEKKYSSELFVDRLWLSERLEQFIKSDETLLPLTGDAGQGKTNQICYWTEHFLDSGKPVIVFSSALFADNSLTDSFRKIFGVSHRRSAKRILDHLHSKALEENQTICFFFDAINECLHYKNSESNDSPNTSEDAPMLLLRDILELLVQPHYPRFKVVTTCRSYTWKNQIRPYIHLPEDLVYKDGEDEKTAIVGFSDSETEIAYYKYGELYQMGTKFEQLDRRIMLRLRDPLIMKFVCSNYVGSPLSEQTTDYTSVQLFEKMLSDIRNRSFAGILQCRLLDELSMILFRSFLDGKPVVSVTNSALRQALSDTDDPLHTLASLVYKKDGLTVAYTELRNKPDRPILRETEKNIAGESVCVVEFIYERFLEFMMARAFLIQQMNTGNIITDQSFVDALTSGVVNVVFIGAMRNALLMEMIRTGDSKIVLDLIKKHNHHPVVMQLVNETLEVMIREHYEVLLFSLIESMLAELPDDANLIKDYTAVKRDIAYNKATSEIIERHNCLALQLNPIITLKNTAGVAVNNMLLSDFFNENLYSKNVLELLWQLILDEIDDVSNESLKFVYYLSRKKYTNSYSPLKENLAKRIVQEMYSDITSHSIVGNLINAERRHRAIIFVEAAIRLSTLLIIDATIAPKQDVEMINEMLGQIRYIASYFTWKFRLVKMVMPFLQTIMRKQITFQSVYVNNAIEYQGFWNPEVVPVNEIENEWCRSNLREVMKFVGLYNRHQLSTTSNECREELNKFIDLLPTILSAYKSGCSFTYFIMERLLIIAGTTDWNAVRPVFLNLFDDSMRSFEWFDYMQMSLLYSLYQLEVNSPEHNPEILEIFTREACDWTVRCRGLFKARHSHKANPTGLYKRNVVNWYCVVYCRHIGDNVARESDSRPVPMLYDLIDQAIDNNDRELLFHLLDNISELISDFGYVQTALSSLKYVMSRFESEEAVATLDAVECERFVGETLVSRVTSVLSTAKTYFPSETDAFIRSHIVGLKFPGVDQFREDILNYHPSGETLSDLFTHKFGNFLLWSLLHEKEVDDFADEAICTAIDSKDCFEWFDNVIRILCRRMFNIKI